MIAQEDTVECKGCQVLFARRKKSANKFCTVECYKTWRAYISREYVCEVCGQKFTTNRNRFGLVRRYCSRRCWKSRIPCKSSLCMQCHYAFTSIRYRMHKGVLHANPRKTGGKFCSYQCHHTYLRENETERSKRSIAMSGRNNYAWKGTKSILASDYRGENWSQLKAKIRKREGYCCKECGISEKDLGHKLDVHHIEPWFNFTNSQIANRMTNLQALCRTCHLRVEPRTNVQICLPFLQGKRGRRFGSMHFLAKFSPIQIRMIRSLAMSGESYRSIGRKFGTVHGIVSNIVNYNTYKDVP